MWSGSPAPCDVRFEVMAKRVFDLVLGGAALVLLSPLMLAIAVAVKLDSPGPVIFRQHRMGRFGSTFSMRKFRTMRADGRGGPLVTAANDPRITRAGRWLRAWKLDELPQLLDVLAGRMSLVGPRPEVPEYAGHWPPELRETILSLRPGLTDPATLLFLNEEERLAASPDPHRTYIEEILPVKARLYADYARTPGLARDVRLLARTLVAVLSRKGSRTATL